MIKHWATGNRVTVEIITWSRAICSYSERSTPGPHRGCQIAAKEIQICVIAVELQSIAILTSLHKHLLPISKGITAFGTTSTCRMEIGVPSLKNLASYKSIAIGTTGFTVHLGLLATKRKRRRQTAGQQGSF